jgi:peroxiredoxin
MDPSKEGRPWLVVYCYPRTGRPDQEPPGGIAAWNAIPGARGCTPQSCAYRDHYTELAALGAVLYGLSTQDTEYQLEAVRRLYLPFPLLSDAKLDFARALRLPTFTFAGHELIKRLTLIARAGRIEEVFYPVFPSDADAKRVMEWLSRHSSDEARPGTATLTLYRPVGPRELALIEASGWREFPPRLEGQPIFYPVLHREYAMQIARDWNVKESGAGFVTEFEIDAEYAERHPVRRVGTSLHEELWVPAEELQEFNRHILSPIRVVAEFHA